MKKVLFLPVVALALLASSCASKGDLNKMNGEVAANKQALDRIQYELARQAEDIKALQARGENDSIDGVAIKDIVIGQQYQLEQLNKLLTTARKDLYRHINEQGGMMGSDSTAAVACCFATGSTTLSKPAVAALDSLANSLKANASWSVQLVGHTDNVGGAAFNKTLSEKRAAAVKNYLVKKGIDAKRIHTKGVGFGKPHVCNDTPEGKAKNRRVDVFVNK
ncbi:MAG: OmpA family protein [Prevotellaceae bacterium]|jgi:outer membrane protein OmpA-like peptidoglycan-associated protein|nr:OmpA family protein [Prevotellaceae bacterium]